MLGASPRSRPRSPGVHARVLLPRQPPDLGHQLVGPGPQGGRRRCLLGRPGHRRTEAHADAPRAREAGAGFGHDTNRVTIIGKDGVTDALPLLPKTEVADAVLDRVERML